MALVRGLCAAAALAGWFAPQRVRAQELPPQQQQQQQHEASVPELIEWAALRRGISPRFLACLVQRESSGRPYATSPYGDQGLVQFKRPTFDANAPRFGWAGATPYDPAAALDVAAGMLAELPARQRYQQWPPSRWCGSPRE